MIEHLPTNTEVEIELADGTKLTNLRTNGNNFVSDSPIVYVCVGGENTRRERERRALATYR